MASLHVDAQTKCWVIRFFDELGVRKTKRTKFRGNKGGKVYAQRCAADLEQEVERRKLGLEDRGSQFAKMPLEEHVSDFEQHLKARSPSGKHQKQVLKRLRSMLRGMGATRIADIRIESVERLLVQIREGGVPDVCLSVSERENELPNVKARRCRPLSAKTRDDYLVALPEKPAHS